MHEIPDHIQIFLGEASVYPAKIHETCLAFLDSQDQKELKKISVYMGQLSHGLRMALNNALWDFCEQNINPALDKGEYNKIRYSHDFPIEASYESFMQAKCRALRHIKGDFPVVYQFLEKVQPYHPGYQELSPMRVMSNDSSHTIPVGVRDGHIDMMQAPGYQWPRIVGEEVIVQWTPSHKVSKYSIPCYIEEMDLYVSRGKEWRAFWMKPDDSETLFQPTSFSRIMLSRVTTLINDFYNLWD